MALNESKPNEDQSGSMRHGNDETHSTRIRTNHETWGKRTLKNDLC